MKCNMSYVLELRQGIIDQRHGAKRRGKLYVFSDGHVRRLFSFKNLTGLMRSKIGDLSGIQNL